MIIEYLKTIAPEITIIGALTLIQIVPIKINPWSWIAKQIRKIIGTDSLRKDFDHLENRIDNIEKKFDEQITSLIKSDKSADIREMKRLRSGIINDYTALINGSIFGEDKYQEIYRDYKDYRDLCAKHDIENGYLDDIMGAIKQKHQDGGINHEIKIDKSQVLADDGGLFGVAR